MGAVRADCEGYCELLFPLKGEHSTSQRGYRRNDCEPTDPQRSQHPSGKSDGGNRVIVWGASFNKQLCSRLYIPGKVHCGRAGMVAQPAQTVLVTEFSYQGKCMKKLRVRP
jgi:hypothetical protein